MIRDVFRPYKEGRIVIYYLGIEDVKTMAEELDCRAYYSHAEEKERLLEQFRLEERMIVATSAFELT